MDTVPINMLMQWLRDLGTAGLPVILFVVWYYDHKKIAALESLAKAFKRLTEESHSREQVMHECTSMSIACLSRIEQKISDNTFCPIMRKEMGK